MLLTFACLSASAIPPSKPLARCRLDTWGIRDGLTGYEITALAQTPDGYLWIGTTQGLLRFDGVSFTLFDRHNLTGFTDPTIRGLGVDADGKLLIGAEWCGYGRMVGDTFVRAPFPDPQWNATHLFHRSPDGSLWVGYQGYAYILRERNGVVTKINTGGGLYMTGIVDLPGGSELVCTEYGGIYTIAPNGAVKPFVASPAIADNDFTAMAQAADGSIWVGTDTHGIYRLQGSHWTHLTTADGLVSNTIHCLYVDSHRRLWIGTNYGIDTPEETSAGLRFAHFAAGDGLASDEVSSILEDREGNLWVASGIYLNRFASTRFSPIGFGSGMMAQISQMTSADNGQTLLCGTHDGLCAMTVAQDWRATQLTNFHVDGAVKLPTGDLFVWWTRDPFSSVIGVVRNGRLLSTQIVKYNPLFVTPSPGGVQVYSAFQDFQPFTIDARGVISPGAPSTRVFDVDGGVQIFDMKPAGQGAFWVGTDHGLGLESNGKGRLLHIPLPTDAHVLSIDASSPNRLWLATDKGLCRVDILGKDEFHLACYTTRQGLPSNNLLQVLDDGRGSLWIGGYFGIFSLALHDIDDLDHGVLGSLLPRLYTSADGIRSYPCLSTPARTSDGKLWFPGQRGLTQIDPDDNVSDSLPPPVQIEDAVANGKALQAGASTIVKPGAGSLTVHYAGLSYVEPEQVEFKYRLVGFDNAWVDAGTKRDAAYTNLAPGRYTFQVIACNDQRVWNKTGASITFVLQPHFYQTVWFKLLLAALGLLAAAGIVLLRTRAVMLKARELEAKVAERTTELQTANTQLSEFEEELRLQNVQLTEAQSVVEARNEELHAVRDELMAQNDELQSVQAELEAQNQELMDTQEHLTEANIRLEALATTDGLTGLYNHRMFHEQLEQEWSRLARYATPLSVVLIDVDRFKLYNDTFGHPAGDDVLRKVAEMLKSTARTSDFVARYGGEEFVVIARESDAQSAAGLAERLRRALEDGDWPQRAITASFGVATVGPLTAGPSELIAQADAALYRSKNAGRNRVTHYRDEDEDRNKEQEFYPQMTQMDTD